MLPCITQFRKYLCNSVKYDRGGGNRILPEVVSAHAQEVTLVVYIRCSSDTRQSWDRQAVMGQLGSHGTSGQS